MSICGRFCGINQTGIFYNGIMNSYGSNNNNELCIAGAATTITIIRRNAIPKWHAINAFIGVLIFKQIIIVNVRLWQQHAYCQLENWQIPVSSPRRLFIAHTYIIGPTISYFSKSPLSSWWYVGLLNVKSGLVFSGDLFSALTYKTTAHHTSVMRS